MAALWCGQRGDSTCAGRGKDGSQRRRPCSRRCPCCSGSCLVPSWFAWPLVRASASPAGPRSTTNSLHTIKKISTMYDEHHVRTESGSTRSWWRLSRPLPTAVRTSTSPGDQFPPGGEEFSVDHGLVDQGSLRSARFDSTPSTRSSRRPVRSRHPQPTARVSMEGEHRRDDGQRDDGQADGEHPARRNDRHQRD